MLQNDLGPVYPLGRVTTTLGARRSLSRQDMLNALLRQMRGEWSSVAGDAEQCELPLALDGCRVLGAYRSSSGQRFWIITEADRSRTTVMLPEEF